MPVVMGIPKHPNGRLRSMLNYEASAGELAFPGEGEKEGRTTQEAKGPFQHARLKSKGGRWKMCFICA